MKKSDLLNLMLIFSLFFVELLPLNVNLLNNTNTLLFSNLTSYFYVALSLYLLHNVIQYLKKNETSLKLTSMYTLGYLISLFMAFSNFDINLVNNSLSGSTIFVMLFGNGNPGAAFAIIINILFSFIFLTATLGLYFLIVYPIFNLIKKVKDKLQYGKYLTLAFYVFVGSKALLVFFDFLINVTTLQQVITILTAFFLFMSWLLNIAAIVAMIIFKIIVIMNIYLKLSTTK